MKNALKSSVSALFAVAFAVCIPLTAGAEPVKVNTITTVLPEYSSSDTVSLSSVSRGTASADFLGDISYYFVSLAEEDAVASQIADSAVLRESTLADGKKTVNISIDFEQGRNRALLNNRVLRKTAKKLVEVQSAAVTEGADYTLMDGIHIVGETELHLIGYEVSKALGGSGGVLGSIYESSRIADLNVDEARFGGLIRIFGVLYSGIFQ